MRRHCPACDGVLYDRRRKTCGFCGATLPAEFLFTPAELESLRLENEAVERKRAQRLKDEAEDRARRDFGDNSDRT